MNKLINKMVRKSGSSFFWGMHILPLKERQAIYTLYAFCRHIDDIVDSNEERNVKKNGTFDSLAQRNRQYI